jgi:hypothetical protein
LINKSSLLYTMVSDLVARLSKNVDTLFGRIA